MSASEAGGAWRVRVGEGYCLRCHYIVAAHNGWLNPHWSYFTNQYYRDEGDKKRLCKGSGKRRWPMPNNPIDPWSWDRKEKHVHPYAD